MTKICYYGDRISEHISKTPEGFLVCQGVPIARTGYQQYLDSELDDSRDDGEIVNVFRSPEEVFSRATLASFEGKPVCNGHPDVDVTPENYNELSCGHVQHVRVGTGEDADKILADLYITDPDLIDEITNGKREVSAGYYAEDNTDNYGRVCQINIRGNHVAVVDKGRAGRTVCIRDSESCYSSKPSKKGVRAMKLSTLKKLRRYLVDAEPEELQDRIENVAEYFKNDGVDILDEDELDMVEDEDDLDMVEDEDDLDMIDDEDDLDMIDDEDDIDSYVDEDPMMEDEDDLDIVTDEDDLFADGCKKDEEELIDDEDEILDEEFGLVEDEDDIVEDEDDVLVPSDIEAPVADTKDAALKKLSKVANRISNRHDRAMMQDAIFKARGKKSQMPGLTKLTQKAKAKRDSDHIYMNVSKQQSIYDSMNPHKNKKS